MAKTLFYYFGDDEAYYRTLLGEFKKQTRLDIEFLRIFESDEKKIQSLFIQVFQAKPVCVFIDFSKLSQDYLHLARIISRSPVSQRPITVGLVDYLSPPEILMESIATGANLTHIKSPECYDVVYDVTKLFAPAEIGEHGFASATLKEEWEGGIPVKIGFITPDGLHLETDHKVQKGDRIRLKHHWLAKRIVPSQDIFIQEVSTKNLFYHFKYSVDADFMFLDEFLPPEGMDEDKVIEKKEERDDLVTYHRKQLSRWIDDNLSNSLEKKAKILVIDRDFNFYRNQQRTDKHLYTIRCVPYLEDIGQDLDRLVPQIIAFAFEKEGEPDPKNTNEQLFQITTVLKNKYADNCPFIVVFNSQISSKEMQANFSYPQMMSTENELSVDLLLKMADVFQKKIAGNLSNEQLNSKDQRKQMVFLKKNNPSTIAEIMIPIKVVKISETDMIIQSESPLPIGLNIHLTSPINMFINVQPAKGQSKVPEYQCLIHSLGESQKKELRRYVNSIFFREHDAKLKAESSEFKKLNEAKLIEKDEALKKADEETKKAADESSKKE